MRINKILAAFGNLGQIAEGIKNNIKFLNIWISIYI